MIEFRILIFFFAAFLSFNSLYSQVTLRGEVFDSETKKIIANVDVFDHLTNRVYTTDNDGRFVMQNLSVANRRLTVFSREYATFELQLFTNKDTSIVVFLEKLSIELTAIELVAKRKEIFSLKQLADVEGTHINAGKKTEVVVMDLIQGNLAQNNSRQVYAQVPGLNIYEGSEGGLQLGIGGRGLDPNRTSNFNTRQNDYDISADVLGYPENYYTPISEAISEIQIIRGASSLQYGTQFGGLINFKLREVPSFKTYEIISKQTVGSFGFFNSFNFLGINKGKFSINSFFNYKRGNGYRPNSEFNAHNVFVSSNYMIGPKTKLKGELTIFNYLAKQAGGLTDDQFESTPRQSTRERNWFKVNWKLYNLTFSHVFSDKTKMTFSLFGLDANRRSVGFRGNPINLNNNPITSIDEQDSNGNFILPRDLILGRFRNWGAEARVVHEYQLARKKSILLFGGKYYKSNNTSTQGPGSVGSDADFELTTEFLDYPNQSSFDLPNLNAAFFGENIFYVSDRFSLIPGFRFEHIKTESIGDYTRVVFDNAGNAIAINAIEEDRELKRSFLLLGLGTSYKRSESLNFYANLSQNYRSVTFSDIRVVNPSFIIDPEIRDEKGFTSDLGIRGRIEKKVSYDLSLFSVVYDDRIGLILDDRANRVRKNIGKAVILGIESLFELNLHQWVRKGKSNLLINWFFNSSFTTSEYVRSEESNVEGNRVEFIPTANMKTGIKVGIKNFIGSLQWTYLSSQFTDAQNSPVALKGDIRSGIIGEIPSYNVLDFTLSYSFMPLGVEVGINNLTNESYFTRRATGYPGPGIIPSDGRSVYFTVTYQY